MNHSRISRVIRRIVLLHLSAAAPFLLACGGTTSPDGGTGGCGVSSTTPLSGGCGSATFPLSGSAAACDANDAGVVPQALCKSVCPPEPGGSNAQVTGCQVVTGPGNTPALSCQYAVICGTGRRPAGLKGCRPSRARGAVAGHLARVAYLEAASVDAFDCLERELAAHGAPRALLAGARRARRDEVRHARVTRALAERAGGVVPSVRVAAGRVRGLEAVALENAVEGCVNEAFGAAVAMVQAETAGDANVRAAMRAIARDELRHAALSFRLAHWLETRLDAPARARIERARAKAARALVRSLSREPPAALVAELGVPDARRARAIARDLGEKLWAATA